MGISYNNLFKLLIDRGWSKTEFAREVGISSNTLRLECTLGDVVQILPPEPPAIVEKLRAAAKEGIRRS